MRVLVLFMSLMSLVGALRPSMSPLTDVRRGTRLAATSSLAESIKSSSLSIGAGCMGIFILLANRLSVDMERITDVQSRADIISVIACSALLLNVLSEQDIVARDRDPVPLVGFALRTPLIDTEVLTAAEQEITRWYITSILDATPATSVHVIHQGLVVGRGGVVGQGDSRTLRLSEAWDRMPIVQRTLSGGEEVYLPDLQILPGKVEFSAYLPVNAQSVVVLPLAAQSAVVVATNQAKALKLSDLAKIRALSKLLRISGN